MARKAATSKANNPDLEKKAAASAAQIVGDDIEVLPEYYAHKKKTSFLDDVAFVGDHLRNPYLKPQDAPSASAMNLLLDARADRKTWSTESMRAKFKLAEQNRSQHEIDRWTEQMISEIDEKTLVSAMEGFDLEDARATLEPRNERGPAAEEHSPEPAVAKAAARPRRRR